MQAATNYNYNNAQRKTYERNKRNNEQLKVVRNNEYKRSYGRRMMFRCLFMVAVLVITAVGFTAYEASVKYEINETNNAIAKVQNEIENLNLEVTKNMSPAVIEQKAIDELGMEYPTASQYVYIDSQK